MISKQNLWFLTLFSLILVLSVYYITMPSDILKQVPKSTETKKDKKVKTKEIVEQENSLVAMRVSLQEERQNLMTDLQKQLTSEETSSEEKNNAYEKLKYLNQLEAKEEELEKQIKEKLKLDCFIKTDNTNIDTVCISKQHNNELANNIMRQIQENYENKMYITVKFQKS